MNDMERRNFEESLQDAFGKAEVQPSDQVWTNVELELARAEGEKMKRRVLFYQLLAAAAVSFAVLFAGLGLYLNNENRDMQLALMEERQRNATQKPSENPQATDINIADASATKGNSASIDTNGDEQSKLLEKNEVLSNDVKGKDHQAMAEKSTSGNEKKNNTTPSGTHTEFDTETDETSNNYAANDPAMKHRPHDINKNTGAFAPAADVAYLNSQSSSIAQETSAESTSEASASGYPKEHGKNVNSSVPAGGTLASAPTEARSEFGENGSPDRHLPELVDTNVQLVFAEPEKVEADPVALMMARLKDLENELSGADKRSKKDFSKEKLWTSIGFAAGAYNSVNASATAPSTSSSMSYAADDPKSGTMAATTSQTKASGVAYTVGLNVGGQISNRWVLQGGVNYMAQMSEYTSSQAVQESGTFKAASVNELRSDAQAMSDEKFVPTAPYSVNNTNEYVSIPVQAGYMILKRKVVLQLNAGIATDLFLQNTIDPEGNMTKTTSGAGSDSPFRSVNFSGLFGSELSYRFNDHYRVGLNPAIRYPFNSIYKDDLGVESTPLTFDIGLRFRYIFN
jgi:hypothetical protein